MACKQANQCSDVQMNTKVFFSSFIRASEETMGSFYFLWKYADTTSQSFVWSKHFTDNCFLNLGQYRAGLDEHLKKLIVRATNQQFLMCSLIVQVQTGNLSHKIFLHQ